MPPTQSSSLSPEAKFGIKLVFGGIFALIALVLFFGPLLHHQLR